MNDVSLPSKALLVVSDGEKALFLRNSGSPQQPVLVLEKKMHQANPATRDQGSDKPGRRAGVSSARGAIEQTDFHQRAEDRFATEVADVLHRSAQQGEFQKLVLMAPPDSLGVLRKHLHGEVSEKLIAEIPKAMTQHPLPVIEKWFAMA